MDDELIIVKGYHRIGNTTVEVDVPKITDYKIGEDPRVDLSVYWPFS